MGFNDVIYRASDRTLYVGKDKHLFNTHGSMKGRVEVSMNKQTEFLANV